MKTVLRVQWLATHVLAFAALSLPLACSAESDQEGTADQAGTLSGPPAADLNAERFNLLPEGASPADGYWVSTVGLDEAGKPVLLDAQLISEQEMLQHSVAMEAAQKTRELTAAGEPESKGVGQLAAGSVVNCNTFPAAPTHLAMYSGRNFQGNRICVQGGGNQGWFALHTWYWGLNTPSQMQVSGNINSYEHYKRFNFQAWTDNTIPVRPVWIPAPGTFTWNTTGTCFSGSAAACGNPQGCVGGRVSNADTTNSCAPYVTWLKI